MNILLIGSKGFVGSNLITFLQNNIAYKVWACDIIEDTSARYYKVDAAGFDIDTVFSQQQFDVTINCSGAANVSESFADPLKDYTLNCLNVFKILDAIKKYNPACRFINLSSAAVYGNPASLPIKEDQKIAPLSPYGYHKAQAETICTEFYKYYNVPTCSLRVFSAYGPGLSKQIFWDIFQKSIKDKEVTLFGTGNESRDFIYIEDLARAVECVIKNAAFKAEVYNVASGVEVSIAEAAGVLVRYLAQGNTLTFNNQTKAGDPINWRADISQLKSFGFTPKYNINEGLKLTVEWMLKKK